MHVQIYVLCMVGVKKLNYGYTLVMYLEIMITKTVWPVITVYVYEPVLLYVPPFRTT